MPQGFSLICIKPNVYPMCYNQYPEEPYTSDLTLPEGSQHLRVSRFNAPAWRILISFEMDDDNYKH